MSSGGSRTMTWASGSGRFRLGRLVSVCTLLVAMVVLTGTSASARGDGISFSNNTVYEVLPDEGVIHVTATYTVTNVTANTTSGNYIRRYYWDGMSAPIPADATDLTITNTSGSSLSWEPVDDLEFESEEVIIADISFGRNLFYRQTTTVVVAYNLPDAGPRADELTRANESYAAFGAYGIGDPGQVDLTVIVPKDFVVETLGSDMSSRIEEDKRIYEAIDIEDPFEFFVFVSARNDDALVSRTVEHDTGDIMIHHWPGDTDWADFMSERIEDDLPVMSSLIGIQFPDDNLEIIETISPTLYGYGGWYDTDSSLIEVTEDLDSRLALHELSHGWFNDDLFTNRFITEGLAEEYASRTIEASGGELTEPPTPARPLIDARSLYAWTNSSNGDGPTETRGYETSWWLMRSLTEDIGVENMSLVIQAADADHIAYVGDNEPEAVRAQDDWRRFLDLLEEVGGSSEATNLFEDWVIISTQEELMVERSAARSQYQSLEDNGADWAPPVAVRSAMGLWKFDEAGDLMVTANEIVESRERITELLKASDTPLPRSAESLYEEADPKELDLLVATMIEHEDAATEIAQARSDIDADRNILEAAGGWFSDAEIEFDGAQAAFAADDSEDASIRARAVAAQVGDFQRQGMIRSGIGFGLLVLVVLVIWGLRRRSKAGQSDGTETMPESVDDLADLEPEAVA